MPLTASAVDGLRAAMVSESNETQTLLSAINTSLNVIAGALDRLADVVELVGPVVESRLPVLTEAAGKQYWIVYIGLALVVCYVMMRWIWSMVRPYVDL